MRSLLPTSINILHFHPLGERCFPKMEMRAVTGWIPHVAGAEAGSPGSVPIPHKTHTAGGCELQDDCSLVKLAPMLIKCIRAMYLLHRDEML